MGPLHWAVLLSALQAAQPTLITGTLKDRPILEAGAHSVAELKPSDDRDLPGVTAGDRIFRGNTIQFRSDAGPTGLAIAFVETDAAWCSPCVAELPELRAARDRFRERGFDVLGMDREHAATSEAVRRFLVEKRVTWPNATSDSVKDLIDNRYRITIFPTLILLDPDGIIVEIGGHIQTMLPRLEQLLEKHK
jgi:peroxiredoxin